MQYKIPFALHHNVLDWLQEKKEKKKNSFYPPKRVFRQSVVETIKINIIIKRKQVNCPQCSADWSR